MSVQPCANEITIPGLFELTVLNQVTAVFQHVMFLFLQWFRIGRHAFFGSAINMMWLFGLTLCGPFRFVKSRRNQIPTKLPQMHL